MTRWTTGHLKPESSQDKSANTCSRMGGQGDDYAVVHERLEESARELACACGDIQSGEHVTFHCPLLQEARLDLIGAADTWVQLDDPRYAPEDQDRATDLVEEWFIYIFSFFLP